MSENKKITLEPNHSLILSEHDRFWMITAGEVDVFYADIDEHGEYVSALRYLYSARAGELLFSLISSKEKEENIKLLIISKGASIISINKNNLLEVDSIFLKSMMEKWILKTAYRIQQVNAPRLYTGLSPVEVTVPLKQDTLAFPTKGLAWCTVVKGKASKYAGNAEIDTESEFNYPFAVNANLWLKSESKDCEIKVISTREAFKDEIFFMLGLNDLQDHLYQKLIKNYDELVAEEQSRIEEKIASESVS